MALARASPSYNEAVTGLRAAAAPPRPSGLPFPPSLPLALRGVLNKSTRVASSCIEKKQSCLPARSPAILGFVLRLHGHLGWSSHRQPNSFVDPFRVHRNSRCRDAESTLGVGLDGSKPAVDFRIEKRIAAQSSPRTRKEGHHAIAI